MDDDRTALAAVKCRHQRPRLRPPESTERNRRRAHRRREASALIDPIGRLARQHGPLITVAYKQDGESFVVRGPIAALRRALDAGAHYVPKRRWRAAMRLQNTIGRRP